MKTWELIDGDIILSNHSISILDKSNALKQRLQNKLNLFLGEFILEPNLGIDWFFNLDKKNPQLQQIESDVRREISSDPEITQLINLEVNYINTKQKSEDLKKPLRSLFISYKANTIYSVLDGQL